MKAFNSYSHEDSDLLEKLIVHLAALKRENLIDTWKGKEIHTGGVIDDHVDAAMEEAQLFLLLVSASFIHSDYCYAKEFARAQERHAAGEAIIVPIIVRESDWKILALRKFKALPKDGKAIISRHWHSPDEAFTDVASGLRKLRETKKQPMAKRPSLPKFVPDERHVTEEQKDKLNALCKDVVERMTAKSAAESENVVKARTGKWFGIIWGQFHEEFGTKEHGLQSLEREKLDAAKSWFVRYRASKDKNFKRVNPQKYRHTLTSSIFTNAGKLGVVRRRGSRICWQGIGTFRNGRLVQRSRRQSARTHPRPRALRADEAHRKIWAGTSEEEAEVRRTKSTGSKAAFGSDPLA